ncbi:MAG: PQQ-binding-like beta-propeller repeat protein [Armatimonadota bacterium]|nr:PQQ-binding-like beta-propeller repeat protein [Armatimonadota bacterium]
MRQRILLPILLVLLLSACTPPPAPPTGLPRPTAPPAAPPTGLAAPSPAPSPPTVLPTATPSGGPTTGSSLTLPPLPTCADLACPWTTLNIARLQGHTPDANVLKLFSAAADPVRQRIYVAGILTRPIAVLDAAGGQWSGTVDSGIDGSAYRYLYLDPVANYLYIVDDSHHRLFRLDLTTNEMAGPVSLPERVGRVAVDTHRARLYLTTPDAPTFRAVDGRTLETLYTADPGPGAGSIAFAEKSDTLYVLNLAPQRGGQIFRLDPETGRVIETISYNAPPAGRPRFLAADDARAHLVVATERVVQVLDLTGQEVSAFPLPRAGELQDLAFDPVHEQLVALWLELPSEGQVAALGGRLQVYDLNTGRTLHELAFGAKPHRLTLDAANGKLYIPEGDASILWSIDTSSYVEATPLRLGDSVEQVVVADGGRRIFLTSRLGGGRLPVP